MTLNPFRYFADQRRLDRETLIAALDRILDAQGRQNDVAIEQSRALRAFIDAYVHVTGLPVRRVSTDETEADAEALKWGLHGES